MCELQPSIMDLTSCTKKPTFVLMQQVPELNQYLPDGAYAGVLDYALQILNTCTQRKYSEMLCLVV